jgi:hypothetical protein
MDIDLLPFYCLRPLCKGKPPRQLYEYTYKEVLDGMLRHRSHTKPRLLPLSRQAVLIYVFLVKNLGYWA